MGDLKYYRILFLFDKLIAGEGITIKDEATQFNVSERSIQRDIEELNNYFSERLKTSEKLIICEKNTYRLQREKTNNWFISEEVLAIAKILLESRAFNSEELERLINKVILQCAPKEKKQIKEMILNELAHYVPLQHNTKLLSKMWALSLAAKEQNMITIHYRKLQDREDVERTVAPLCIIFSEYYFYLVAHRLNPSLDSFEYEFPALYRLDRIKDYKPLANKKYSIPNYNKRFQPGEFRKRIQFMQPGEIIKIKFLYWGGSIEAVMDRLPTAVIVDEQNKKYLIEAEVYGLGIEAWLLSQAQYLQVLEPVELKAEIKKAITEMMKLYC